MNEVIVTTMIRNWKRTIGCILFCTCSLLLEAHVVFHRRQALTLRFSPQEAPVVHTAFDLFCSDYRAVFGQDVRLDKDAVVCVGTLGVDPAMEQWLDPATLQTLRLHSEAFAWKVTDGKLYIAGSDRRGTAYGLLQLSRFIGVSPWVWWADVRPEQRESLTLEEGFTKVEYPSVRYRGIFVNDEDWGLTPWSWQTFEPSAQEGRIGPKTHARIFELLLRLRANTFWPAMHTCSVPFYKVPGNRETADRYGILVGTSHCEPMMRNTNAEWDRTARGSYDYVHNRDSVLAFWEERVKELAGSDNIYTLGIRGEHDSKMLGAETVEEQKAALDGVLRDQRAMLARWVHPDMTRVPQVFIPYKEVLDVYKAGLEVPDDVALMWCDDNYGYIRHFPDSAERARKGGNGMYYHLSYWGRPHDYLWLATQHPAMVYTQMKRAYDKGVRNSWIMNVGDIKPGEYLLELCMDMAWNLSSIEDSEQGLDRHLQQWLAASFGDACAKELLPVWKEYYRLAYIRKPEFMGNTRTEEKDPSFKVVCDLPWSQGEIEGRLADYRRIEEKVKKLRSTLPPSLLNAWFQLVEYPVCAAAAMNRKCLYAQLARHGLAGWEQSDAAYAEIVRLTEHYNALEKGKWHRMMDHQPRRLPVFDPPVRTKAAGPLAQETPWSVVYNGRDYQAYQGQRPVCYGMGYEAGAIHLEKGSSVTYRVPVGRAKGLTLELALAPNHPVEGRQLRYAVSVDGGQPQVVDYHTEGRSEEWKMNVIRNQALRQTQHSVAGQEAAQVTITALDEGVVIDQLRCRTSDFLRP